MVKAITRQIGNWVVKERRPEGEGPHPLILLLHGWTGDEQSMWVFASRLPDYYWLAAPRGLYPAQMGGFNWVQARELAFPQVKDFQPAVEALLELLSPDNFPGAELDRFFLAGFSQGAALAYSLAFLHPQRVKALAGLSGFVPADSVQLIQTQPLFGMHIFVAHGTQDALVPVEKARAGVILLQKAGARVSYCEDDVGHKLSASCFGGFQSFFKAMEY